MRRIKLPLTAFLALFLVYSGTSTIIASQAARAKRNTNGLTPASVGLPYRNVNFPSRNDGVALKGWFIPRENAGGTVILVHGIDSYKSDAEVGRLELARKLFDRNISVFMFDLRGHGESGDGKLSAGLFEQLDFLGAFDWLVGQGVPPGKIGTLGLSLGGAIVLLSTGQERGLQAVVADSAFSDVSPLRTNEVAKRLHIPRWLAAALDPGVAMAAQAFYGIDFQKIIPERQIGNLDYPLLLIHSKTDERIPYEHALELMAASINPATTLWTVDQVEHAKAFLSAPDDYADRVSQYFQARWQ